MVRVKAGAYNAGMPTRPPTFGHVKTQRPSAAKRGYDRRWREYRQQYLAAHPACVGVDGAHAAGCDRIATVVDHVRPVRGQDDQGFWDAANHQALSAACHQLKSEKDGTRARDGGRWA